MVFYLGERLWRPPHLIQDRPERLPARGLDGDRLESCALTLSSGRFTLLTRRRGAFVIL